MNLIDLSDEKNLNIIIFFSFKWNNNSSQTQELRNSEFKNKKVQLANLAVRTEDHSLYVLHCSPI